MGARKGRLFGSALPEKKGAPWGLRRWKPASSASSHSCVSRLSGSLAAENSGSADMTFPSRREGMGGGVTCLGNRLKLTLPALRDQLRLVPYHERVFRIIRKRARGNQSDGASLAEPGRGNRGC